MHPVSNQRTIANPCEYTGIGIHTGKEVTLRFVPAEPDTGISFVRTDIESRPAVKADINNVVMKLRRTVLSQNDTEVETVEHLLAAATGMGIDNLIVEMNGSEVPGGDGSARDFVNILGKAGAQEQDSPRIVRTIEEVVSYHEGEHTMAELKCFP